MNRKKRRIRKEKVQRKNIFILIISVIFVIVSIVSAVSIIHNNKKDNDNKNTVVKNENNTVKNKIKKKVQIDERKEIVISAIGDLTLGTDTKFSYSGSFNEAVDNCNKDYSSFMKNVIDVLGKDDYTIGNLETTFTDSNNKASKSGKVVYNFKGSKEYVDILKKGSIEGVTTDNNHIYDYGQEGLNDTINTLKDNSVDLCGNGYSIIREIKGVKIGFLGYSCWYESDEMKDKIKNDISNLKNQGCEIVIPYFHWGEESKYTPNDTQVNMGRFAIDNGADLVLGSHSHCIQTIEKYKGKLIAYSLGNFCFGGNSNPKDKNSMILQIKVNLLNGNISDFEYKVIPVTISSVDYKNDYIPTIASGDKKDEIISKINELSPTLEGIINVEYFKI